MRSPRRNLSDQDRMVWAQYAAQLRPLPGRSVIPATLPPLPAGPLPAAPAAPPATAGSARPGMLLIGTAPPGLDKASWQRFRTGKMPSGRRLDLHGHTAQRAYDRFEHVLQATAAQGIRCLEVITGRGTGEAGGILRRELPLWLNLPHLRPLILAAAHPHAANDGAVLLLLRRGKEPRHPDRLL